jgi:hypothetical protein
MPPQNLPEGEICSTSILPSEPCRSACGRELLKQFKDKDRPKGGGHYSGTDTVTSAARDAGMSKRQKDTAVRVASVPRDEFEAARCRSARRLNETPRKEKSPAGVPSFPLTVTLPFPRKTSSRDLTDQ